MKRDNPNLITLFGKFNVQYSFLPPDLKMQGQICICTRACIAKLSFFSTKGYLIKNKVYIIQHKATLNQAIEFNLPVILKLFTRVTHYFSHYAALGVDNLSSSLCAAFKAA